jgi:hypothetical protein
MPRRPIAKPGAAAVMSHQALSAVPVPQVFRIEADRPADVVMATVHVERRERLEVPTALRAVVGG